MPTNYEIELDVAIAKIRDALLADPNFVNQLAAKLRSAGFRTARSTPGANGSSPRNPNSSPINI